MKLTRGKPRWKKYLKITCFNYSVVPGKGSYTLSIINSLLLWLCPPNIELAWLSSIVKNGTKSEEKYLVNPHGSRWLLMKSIKAQGLLYFVMNYFPTALRVLFDREHHRFPKDGLGTTVTLYVISKSTSTSPSGTGRTFLNWWLYIIY